MEQFKIMNEKQKKNDKNDKNDKNMDRKKYLEKHISTFDTIKSEAEKLIEEYGYKNIEFYGIILCYFNFYNKKNFSLTVDYLFKNKPNDLYEILLIYYSHFKNPINQNFEFFNQFIKYTILNKEFTFFERGLSYIRDIETYLNIIEKNKVDIFNKYIKDNKEQLKHIIKLDKNIKNIKAENVNQKNSDAINPIKPEVENKTSETMIIEGEGNSKKNNENLSVKKIAENTNTKVEKKKKMILYLKSLNLLN